MSKLMQYIINWLPRECYLLRDEFTIAEAAPLGSPRICRPGPGQLILDQTDGQFSIVGGEFVFPAQGTPVWGDQDWYALDNAGVAYARALGRVLKYRFAISSGTNVWVGWNNDNTPTTYSVGEYAIWLQAAGAALRAYAFNLGIVLRDNWPAANQYGQAAFALSPYTSTGLHWYPSALGTFDYGAHFFFRDEAGDDSWRLAWYRETRNNDPLYPAFSNYETVGQMDYTLIPCDDTTIWHPLFTPIAYDEFTDANGVLLPNHTMTYGGYAWVNAVGVWQITGNEADPDNSGNAHCYIAVTKPDVWTEANMLIPTGVSASQGLAGRKSVDTSGGLNLWLLLMRGNTAGDDTFVYEYADGVGVSRAAADNDWADNTTYNLRGRYDGTQITFYVDYVEVGHYATAWFNRHATWFGLFASVIDAARFDNFIILPRGTGLERIAYDSFTDPNGTSLDAHTMDEGGLAWVESVGDWDIQGNEASTSAGAVARAHAHAVTNASDVYVEGRVFLAGNYPQSSGVIARKSADTGGGPNYWYFWIGANRVGDDTFIVEYDNGVLINRAVADIDYVNQRYYMLFECEGQSLTGYVDGTQRVQYATATFNETALWHGVINHSNTTHRFDQFRITEIPTLGEYDAALDGI